MTADNKEQKPQGIRIGMRNIKTALAAMLCALIYYPFGRNPTFACIGAIFGMGSSMGNSWKSGGNRLMGTIIGGFLGMGLFRIYICFYPEGGMHLLMMALLFIGVVLLILASQHFKWPGAVQPGGVMLCIILFNTPVQTYISYSLNRMLDTGIGVVVALAVNLLLPRERVEPSPTTMRLSEKSLPKNCSIMEKALTEATMVALG